MQRLREWKSKRWIWGPTPNAWIEYAQIGGLGSPATRPVQTELDFLIF